MNPDQMKLLRDVAAMDKGNAVCIAILNLLDLVERQERQINDLLDELWEKKGKDA